MQMDHSHSARHRNSKHEDTVFYYTDVDITPRPPPPSYEKNTAPRISSDILEVTNNKGAVGFVAVGRVRNYQGPNPSPHYHTAPNLPRSADQHNRHADTNYEGQVSRNHQRPIHADHYADYYHSPMHSRHHSEPTLIEDRDNIPFNRSTPNRLNSRDEIYETPTSRNASITTVASEPTNRRVKKSKRNRHSKSCSQSESERKEPESTRHIPAETSAETPSPSTPPSTRDRVGEENREASTKAAIARAQSFANAYPLCKLCGQHHRISENHEYDYVEEVDDDLQCDICLQPFVDPFDTKCGHTYCSICLKNYVRIKKMCPIDRKELNFSANDCWQSSLVMRKLVDKLVVHCPNTELCKLTLPRSELSAHLKERCPGSILRCPFAMFGCSFKGPREEEKEHEKKCKFQHLKGDPVDSIYPDCAKHVVEMFRPEGTAELGIAIVGGSDTPIRNIIIQGIVPGSLVAEDGRIHPGDIIIDVNGEDLHNVSHVEARTVLSRSSRLMRFTLLREKAADSLESPLQELGSTKKIAVSLLKPPSEQLGIKITTSESGLPGIYILELVPGKVAHSNGQLQVGDRILEIAHVDLWDGSPDLAARIIQGAGERVDIVVNRHVSDTYSTIANPWATDKTLPRNAGNSSPSGWPQTTTPKTAHNNGSLTIPIPESLPMNSSYQEKVISLKKAPNESLGIVVAGGMTGVRGDLPVFVQDIQPMGVLGKDKRLQRGDLLIQVNGVELTGLSHSQAIAVLKDTAQHCKAVSLTAVELSYAGKEEDFALWEELSGVHHQRSRKNSFKENNWSSWTPSWKMWLAVPPRWRIPRDVVIKKGNRGELGFSIVGGFNEKASPNKAVFVKYVVPNSPAALQGRIRCGDEIVAVNGSVALRMTHSEVVQALKNSSGSVVVSIMSWPGSVH